MKQFTTSLMLLVAFLFTSNHLSAQTYHEGNWYSLYQSEFELATTTTSWDGEQQDFTVFAPTNGNLQFDYIYVIWGGVLGNLSKVQKTHIYEITNFGKDTIEMAIVEGTDTENIMSANVSLSTNIDSVRFDRPVGNTNTVKYTNVRLPLAYHILLADNAYGKSTDSLTFEEKPLFQVSEPQTIPLRSFHAAGDITITCQHPDVFRIGSPDNTSAVTWAVGPNACASQNGQDNAMAIGEVLGDIDMYNLTIYFCPQHAIDYTDTIVISDGVSSATIAVSGKGLPIGQSIDWQFTDTQMTVDETIALTATATSGLEVAFTIVGDQTIASINNNQLTAHKAGTITVQASQAGNADYFAAETISHTINISKATPQITELPTIAPVTYGTTLAEALVLNGGKASVEGTFNITKPTADELTQVWDAGEHTIHITFVPTMADAYNSVEATTTLTITPATQTIDWTIDATTLLVNATLPLNATASSGLEVTYTITDGQDIVAIEGNNIVAKKAGTATITASQAGNNNYLAAASVAQTITVEKATPQITELPTIAPVTYGTTLAEALVLNGGKASVEGTFTFILPTHEDYLQQVWDAGEYAISIAFYPTQEEAYYSIDTTVVLLIEKAAQTIAWTLDSTNLFVNDTIILAATASSKLPVTYEVTGDEGVVTIQDNVLVAIQAGTITITASQEGNNNYHAAEPVVFTLTVEDIPSAIIDVPTNDHTKKFMRNGKIYILHNGVYYDTLGNTIK